MRRMVWVVILSISFAVSSRLAVASGVEEPVAAFETLCQGVESPAAGRVVCADIVALEQTLVYNRFGSFNPYGMIFALRRDVVSSGPGTTSLSADYCGTRLGTETGSNDLSAGEVRLKDCKRPRPVTLRVNVGDHLLVRVGNLLTPSEPPDFSRDFCQDSSPEDEGRRRVRVGVRDGDKQLVAHGEADCLAGEKEKIKKTKKETKAPVEQAETGHAPDWPRTRILNFVVQGLHSLPDPETNTIHPACRGLAAVAPGESFNCLYSVDQEGTYFFASSAAPAGGEGDGGSIVHGLFGAIVAQRQGSRWYRSQVTNSAMDYVWERTALATDNRHARSGQLDYEATHNDIPLLNMARTLGAPQNRFDTARHLELVHSDLNAIIWCNESLPEESQDCRPSTDAVQPTTEPGYAAFREFSVFFHDELKTFYTENFRELGQLGQMTGIKDGFAINYGASGMGSVLLANRKGIGPSADCMECLYEEFFLTSWANGDPALLEWYADDPSNVHHSYLNDPVVFRNFHAGPKETHVFHLHAHQWFAGNDPNRGSYLDSQTVSPQQGFTYNIYHGGLRDQNGAGSGWWDTQGSGNRNRTVGDSIFHCHLYPHFAQGMWALWRVHDVFEDGTRKLPDGQASQGLSLDFVPRNPDGAAFKRAGSIDRETGEWLEADGTPVPAIVPLPGEALPLLPTYANAGDDRLMATASMPGYPFYVGGQPGHRPPQAPLDIARNLGPNPGATLDQGIDTREDVESEPWLAAGLNRHIIGDGSTRKFGASIPLTLKDGTPSADLTGERKSLFYSQLIAKSFALGDLSASLSTANIEPLSPWGTLLERSAMGFHFNGNLYEQDGGSSIPLKLETTDGSALSGQIVPGAYSTPTAPTPIEASSDETSTYFVNGSAPKPGAPFADPCGVAQSGTNQSPFVDPLTSSWLGDANFHADPKLDGFRRYDVSAVQLDMIVNSAGWHDPQARINVLTAESDRYKDGPSWRVSPLISDNEEPFFFRALSGECIEFRHTNELPKDLELDDFQVKTPTDTVGQHIHLVKFDVTSSDGSGNGWNYEDGTLAPDEVASRLCAWAEVSDEGASIISALSDKVRTAMNADELDNFPDAGICEWEVYKNNNIWRLARSRFPFLFQTTTQRWFADPILSDDGNGAVDRTMRTVFTHDHFGPSSIQQHGFYSALVVEPPAWQLPLSSENTDSGNNDVAPESRDRWFPEIRPPGNDGNIGRPLTKSDRLASVAWGGDAWIGSQKRIVNAPDAFSADAYSDYFQHPNYREFMLSIADFALLYDPRDREAPAIDAVASASSEVAEGLDGMARLHCEAFWRLSPGNLDHVCGVAPVQDTKTSSYFYPGEIPPAYLAGGVNRDDQHKDRYAGDLITDSEIDSLAEHFVTYRQKAAGKWHAENGDEQTLAMAKPVAAPVRPESISVDHHDPYLVNYRGAPIPLRIGTKEEDGSISNDCKPKQLNRVGEDGSSDAVFALANGTFGECSMTYQRSDEAGGDMGTALASRFHGDPETPILEAYQDERLAIRLIQGAQEVQHTFNVAGQPFKRNIDQHWKSGMQPLGQSAEWDANPTLQSACLERRAIERLETRDYRKWRDTAPANRASVGFDTEDIKDIENYEAALAECDNIEGFTYAQEIGISEHFEMQGSLRADVGASAEAAPLTTADINDTVLSESKVPLASSDYLYNFGSLDAFWNGAWGLIRVFADDDAFDPATLDYDSSDPLSASPERIGERLSLVPRDRKALESAADNDSTFSSRSGLVCPVPASGESLRIVDTVVAAVEMRRVFKGSRGTHYGERLYDPDGLFLALLTPEELGLSGIEDVEFEQLKAKTVLSAIASNYANQPEPFVLRVHAGDCLRLRVVNLLGDENGARDSLGDAILPKIVPLNTDPIPSIEQVSVGKDGESSVSLGMLERPEGPASGVRPSTQLALNFGLPGLDLIREIPQGFGYNADPLPGGNGGVAVSKVLVTYAGRVRIDVPQDSDEKRRLYFQIAARTIYEHFVSSSTPIVEGSLIAEFTKRMKVIKDQNLEAQALSDEINRQFGLVSGDPENAFGRILGEPVTLELWDGSKLPFDDQVLVEGCVATGCNDDIAALNDTLAKLLDSAIKAALSERAHWIPYAFGTVPVRPLADPIGQIPHGLFGAIDVVPVNWQPVSDSGLHCQPVDEDGYERCTASYVAPEGDGQPFVWKAIADNGKEVQLREFVLFWRDGMNLWDDKNAPPWQWSDDVSSLGTLGTMVPDCPVCDDSYDRGEAGVSHNAPSFPRLLSRRLDTEELGVSGAIHQSDDLNAYMFPSDYLSAATESVNLKAKVGEQVVIRVVHPGGRARQRAFSMNGYSYDDLFPGFGFPRSALLAPGKSVTAWLRPDAEAGTVIWHDGPTYLRSAGAWGLLTVEEPQP